MLVLRFCEPAGLTGRFTRVLTRCPGTKALSQSAPCVRLEKLPARRAPSQIVFHRAPPTANNDLRPTTASPTRSVKCRYPQAASNDSALMVLARCCRRPASVPKGGAGTPCAPGQRGLDFVSHGGHAWFQFSPSAVPSSSFPVFRSSNFGLPAPQLRIRVHRCLKTKNPATSPWGD